MAEKKWDAIVIGSGPAGASAARTLVAGGMSPLIIEKKKLPRTKMCSGILSQFTVDFVHRKFGPIPESVYCQPQFLTGLTIHFPSLPEPVVIPPKNAIPNVWRSKFDYFLANFSDAKIRDGLMVQNIEQQADGFKVTCKGLPKSGKSSTTSFKSRYLVAADGSNSRAVRLLTPEAVQGVPYGTGLQLHYRGEVNLDPHHYNTFFYPDMGFYAWSNIKDDIIRVGVGGIGSRKLPPYHANFVSLLEKRYGLKIKETVRREGMAGVMLSPLNRFALGKGNFLAAGDAGGFAHNGGEGISCALTTGDLAGEAILEAEKTGQPALEIYRKIVRGEAELCLDQFNPLRMMQTSPMPVDLKAVWRKHSLRDMYMMWEDLKTFGAQDNGFADTGVGKVVKQNILHYLRHRSYPLTL